MHFIVRYPLAQKEKWAYVAVVVGLLSWFVVDSVMSGLQGAWFNIWLVNIPCLLLLGVPLALMYSVVFKRVS